MIRIPEDMRSDIRFTAFFIGNGTLVPRKGAGEEYDIDYGYRELLQQQPRLLEEVVCVYSNVSRQWDVHHPITPSGRAAQWMLQTYDPQYHPDPPFAEWELSPLSDPVILHDYFDALKLFARHLAHGFPYEAILQGWNYMPTLWDGGSMIESYFAVFSNVLLIDTSDHVLNIDAALHRTAQWIRQTVDPTYKPHPPFAVWEYELV